MTALRDASGHFLPGVSGNPSGRPTLNVSLSKLFRDKLESQDGTAEKIVQAWIDKCILERDMPAIREALDRTEGKVAEKHQIEGVIVHISDAYAQKVLEAMCFGEAERQERLGKAERALETPDYGQEDV